MRPKTESTNKARWQEAVRIIPLSGLIGAIAYSTTLARLSRYKYKRPKISEDREHQVIAAPKDKRKAPGKGKGKGRNFGKLAHLKEMPLDVLFEVRNVFSCSF